MIADIAFGSATVPDSSPDEPITVVVKLDVPMTTTDYDVSVLRSVWTPGSAVKVTRKEAKQVTVTVTAPAGMAGAGVLHIVCVRRTGAGQPAITPPETPGKPT